MQNNVTKAFKDRISEIFENMGDHTTAFEITMSAAVDDVSRISYKVDEITIVETLPLKDVQISGLWRNADVKKEN